MASECTSHMPGELLPLILLVHPDTAEHEPSENAIRGAGLRAISAETLDEGYAMFAQLRPDLVVVDASCVALCARIRGADHGSNIPILVLLDRGDAQSVALAFDALATDILIRPLSHCTIATRIQFTLRNSKHSKNLREANRHLYTLQRMAGIGYWQWRVGTDELVLCAVARGVLQLTQSEQVGFDAFIDLIHPEDQRRIRLSLEGVPESGEPIALEYALATPVGNPEIIIQQSTQLSLDDDNQLWLSGTLKDITQRRMAERKIVRLAYYDPQSGLPNLTFLREALDSALHHQRDPSKQIAVLSIDIDELQRINGSFGHNTGDNLIVAFAERLAKIAHENGEVMPEHTVTLNSVYDKPGNLVSRSGGDEFTLLLSDLDDAAAAEAVAERIVASISQPFHLAGKRLVVTASIGIALFPEHGRDTEALLKNAAAARHNSHSHNRAIAVYSDALNQETRQKLNLELGVRRALDNRSFEGFELYYQPRVNAKSGAMMGVEALLRWTDRELGPISPTELIPVAEASGLINPIGAWVLEEAARQAKRWLDSGVRVPISVNISVCQFRTLGFVDFIRRTLEETRLPPSLLELEITESILMDSTETSREVLDQLSRLGVSVALDDFGTGYSSLSYLNRFPVDTVKIDRSFIMQMESDPRAASIVKIIISLSQSLRLHIVAEGVETEAQLMLLREWGCYEIQGYFFSKPLSARDLLLWARSHQKKLLS